MNLQEQLLLSSYLIKAAGKSRIGAGIVKALGGPKPAPKGRLGDRIRKSMAEVKPTESVGGMEAALKRNAQEQISKAQAARAAVNPAQLPAPNLPGYIPPPAAFSGATQQVASPMAALAPSVVNPQGLALARQGLGQLGTGLNQALRTGVNTARARIGSGLSTAGAGISSAARNPLVQAGGVGLGAGLLGGAAGVSIMNRLSSGASSDNTQAPTSSSNPNYTINRAGNMVSAAPTSSATPSATPSAPSEAFNPYRQLSEAEVAELAQPLPPLPVVAPGLAAPTPAAKAQPAIAQNAEDLFEPYMGTAYDPYSPTDRKKLKVLQDLIAEGRDLRNPNKANASLVYGRM